jgi:broad specificity phosphatase PhoE
MATSTMTTTPAPGRPAHPAPAGTATLWLVRHGESTWNALGLAQGHSDRPRLTRRGVRQAWRVAGHLCDQPVRAVYASDLARALHTAAPLASVLGLPVIRDARLRERALGTAEGGPLTEVGPQASGIRDGRVADPDARPPGGESVAGLYRRAAAFAAGLAAASAGPPGGPPDAPADVIVVTHGGTLRVLAAYLRGFPPAGLSWEPVPNASIVAITSWPPRPATDLD